MRYEIACHGIENAKSFLRPITQVDCVALQPRERVITWNGRKSGITKNTCYPLEYQHLLDSHQYSLLLTDGSFFQFYYEFGEGDVLANARLAYYPKPVSTRDSSETLMSAAEEALDREDEILYEHIYNWVELLEVKKQLPSNTSHIRFDYDHKARSHAPSHIQFGAIQEFRITADFYPLPLAFIELCVPIMPIQEAINIQSLNFADRSKHSSPRINGSIFLGSSQQ